MVVVLNLYLGVDIVNNYDELRHGEQFRKGPSSFSEEGVLLLMTVVLELKVPRVVFHSDFIVCVCV